MRNHGRRWDCRSRRMFKSARHEGGEPHETKEVAPPSSHRRHPPITLGPAEELLKRNVTMHRGGAAGPPPAPPHTELCVGQQRSWKRRDAIISRYAIQCPRCRKGMIRRVRRNPTLFEDKWLRLRRLSMEPCPAGRISIRDPNSLLAMIAEGVVRDGQRALRSQQFGGG